MMQQASSSEAYKSHHVSVVVVLAEDEECLHKAKRNLHAFYAQEGLEVIHCPIRDFSVPSFTDLQTHGAWVFDVLPI